MPKIYTTISGDMWDLIARRELGSEMQTDALIKANIKHRHIFVFPADIKLTIPDLPVKPHDSLPPWKRGGTV